MTIKFCGAAREVTGSCHLVTLDNGFSILLDCGLYQGRSAAMKDFNEKWLFNPAEIGCMVLSHAHIDHTGRIPKLVADGFRAPIHCTHATRDLAGLMLLDSAKIQESDAQFKNKKAQKRGEIADEEPLYTADDVRETMRHLVGHNYEEWVKIHENVEVYYTDAGHILGSSSVTLKITEGGKTTVVGFTGDIGRPNRPILRDPQPMPECDFIICESTYGDRLHEHAPAELNHLIEIIDRTCHQQGGKIIVPAFSVGRSQEVVYIFDKLVSSGKLSSVKVFVDSPLAVDATNVFIAHPECFDAELHDYMLTDPNPFGFKDLQFIRDTEGSKRLNELQEPAIIISSSGMANAGRVKHHIFNNVENPKNTILIVGYASPETPAGQLRAGAKQIRLFGEYKRVRAAVEIMDSFSAHGDYNEMTDFLSNHKASAKNIFLVHGDSDAQAAFQKHLTKNGFQRVDIPALGDTIEIKNNEATWLALTPLPSQKATDDERRIESEI
jgi:metallo-beta-lactamase family protein